MAAGRDPALTNPARVGEWTSRSHELLFTPLFCSCCERGLFAKNINHCLNSFTTRKQTSAEKIDLDIKPKGQGAPLEATALYSNLSHILPPPLNNSELHFVICSNLDLYKPALLLSKRSKIKANKTSSCRGRLSRQHVPLFCVATLRQRGNGIFSPLWHTSFPPFSLHAPFSTRILYVLRLASTWGRESQAALGGNKRNGGKKGKSPELCNRLLMTFTKSCRSLPSLCTKYRLLKIICEAAERPLGAPWWLG